MRTLIYFVGIFLLQATFVFGQKTKLEALKSIRKMISTPVLSKKFGVLRKWAFKKRRAQRCCSKP